MTYEKKYISPKQSLGEEIANSITHGIGAALATAALTILVVFAASNFIYIFHALSRFYK
jgi:hemolysin III